MTTGERHPPPPWKEKVSQFYLGGWKKYGKLLSPPSDEKGKLVIFPKSRLSLLVRQLASPGEGPIVNIRRGEQPGYYPLPLIKELELLHNPAKSLIFRDFEIL